jgi:hypothetical protein
MICRWSSRGAVPAAFSCASCGRRDNACSTPACASRRWCDNCCACGSVPLRDQERNLFLGEPSKRFPRYVGVEVECGKLATAKVKGWAHVKAVSDKYRFRVGTDGSIHEFKKSTEISTTPARGDVLDAQLKDLGEALIADEIKANSSCGFHVHVDVRDYTIDHLMNAVYLWDRLEKPLYRLVAKSRRTNHFSKVWGDKFKTAGVLDRRSDIKEREKKLDAACYGSAATAQQYKMSRGKHDSRYHGLNLNSISVHGTIEFRLHHGTVNPTKMRMWTAVCSAIVQFAFEHTEEEIRSMKGTNTEVLERVIGDPEVIAWTRARRVFFANQERQAHGLVPLAKAVKPATGTHRRSIPMADAGEVEMSEGASAQSGR